jgi:hypothetical protein
MKKQMPPLPNNIITEGDIKKVFEHFNNYPEEKHIYYYTKTQKKAFERLFPGVKLVKIKPFLERYDLNES